MIKQTIFILKVFEKFYHWGERFTTAKKFLAYLLTLHTLQVFPLFFFSWLNSYLNHEIMTNPFEGMKT